MTRVTELFAMRLARRRGETQPGEDTAIADLDRYGESMGLAPSAMPKGAQTPAPAMPGRPLATGSDTAPAGDALSSMAPPGGGPAAPQTDTMRARAEPMAPGRMPSVGIPALDELADRPRPMNRGLMHNRKLGRVM